MRHLHFEQCPSTQTKLKEFLSQTQDWSEGVLVSTQKQTQGVGRLGHSWQNRDNALAFSFLFQASTQYTLSSLELAVLMAKFLEKEHQTLITLKWPNDLLSGEGLKVGGILCQGLQDNWLAVGIGINWGEQGQKIEPNQEFKSGLDHLNDNLYLESKDYFQLPLEIYQYIQSNRLSSEEIINEWQKYCAHMDQQVEFEEGSVTRSGLFKGLGSHGEAMIEVEKKQIIPIVSGSLNFYLRD